LRLDALVWGLTKLFPASMRGLFNSSGVEHAFSKPKDENALTDLHEELYGKADDVYNAYTLGSGDDDNYSDEDFMYNI